MRAVASPAAVALMALMGCVSYTRTSPAPAPHSVAVVGGFSPVVAADYEKQAISFKNRTLHEEESSLYRVRLIRFPSYGENGQKDNLVTGRYHESKRTGEQPLVVIVPVPDGHVYPAEKMTAYLKAHSRGEIHVFNMHIDQDIIDWQGMASAPDEATFMRRLEVSAEREWTTVIDIRRVLDWAEARPEIDPRKIALLGFSHGGIVAAGVAVQEPRLAATVLVMAGALLHQPMVRCPLERSAGMRQKALTEFGWSEAELESRIAAEFSAFEPANFPGRVDPTKVLIVEAARDDCIPESGREALWETMGRPERILLDYRHKQAFLSMTPLRRFWLRHRIWDFLQDALQLKAEADEAL